MSYLVMARRWRPQTFNEVIGQEHVTHTLQQAIKLNRVAHAYIFTGARGIGKTTCARLLAKAVNCPNLKPNVDGFLEPCNECPSCKDITSGSALDVIEIDGASNNRVEDVRTLRENIKFAPSSFPKKVYIIDEVHMLSGPAFNALLKTLEEPPEHAMFIFATTEIHKVPATVLSRCQRFDFKRIPVKDIRLQLQKIIDGDNLKVDQDATISIAVKAAGALRDALSILDQLVAYQGDDPITGDVVRQALGLIDTDIYFKTTDIAASGDIGAALELTETITHGGHDSREFLHGFQRHVLNLLYIKAGGDVTNLEVPDHYKEMYLEAAQKHSDEDFIHMGDWAAETTDLLREAIDPELRLELFMVKLANMDRAINLGILLEQLGVKPAPYGEQKKNLSKTEPVPAETLEEPPITEQTEAVIPLQEPITPEPSTPETPEELSSPAEPVEFSNPEQVIETEEKKQETFTEQTIEDNDLDEDINSEPDTGEKVAEPQLSLIREDWLNLCNTVNMKSYSLGLHLEAGAPTRYDEGTLEISFEKNGNFHYETVRKHPGEISSAFRKIYGVPVKITFRIGDIPDELRPPKRKSQNEAKQETFKHLLEDRPVWKEMVERFDLKFKK